jgi:2-polyprenyl-6-methoxyphenol hydroxylase-like FAD-dependent oxidoreductase
MEILRPWGIEASLREQALPSGAFRFIWVESLAGREIGRVEPPHRDIPGLHSPTYLCMAAQDAFEAELRHHADTYPEIALWFNTELTAFEQDDTGVTATLRDRHSEQIQSVRASYMIAADGASSRIREALSIGMVGLGALDQNIIATSTSVPSSVRGSGDGRLSGTYPRKAMARCCGPMEPTAGWPCTPSSRPAASGLRTSRPSGASTWLGEQWASLTCRSS